MKKIETRKDEVIFTTSNIKEMAGRYLAQDVKRGWAEDFIDEDTAEVVTIQRHEIIFPRGTHISNDVIPELKFYMETGDITEVEVSNQQRAAHLVYHNGLAPWSVTAFIGKKKHKILLYANSVEMALEVAKDYIELNFRETFTFLNIRDFTSSIILKDNLRKADEADQPENQVDKKFYKIEVKVVTETGSYTATFIVHTEDVDAAMVLINNYLYEQVRQRNEENGNTEQTIHSVSIESAITISCSFTIDREFSLAYIKPTED